MNRLHLTPSQVTADTPESGANTETVVNTTPVIYSEFPNPTVILTGFVAYTPPAAITSLTIRVRRDSLTGTIVGEAEVDAADVVASKLSMYPVDFVDTPAGMLAGVYVLTVQGAGEGAAGTCNGSSLSTIVG